VEQGVLARLMNLLVPPLPPHPTPTNTPPVQEQLVEQGVLARLVNLLVPPLHPGALF
jgi:hypothetical protein